jgi:ABC-type sugar transport system ATPase subunit
MSECILEALEITKKFPGVIANDRVTMKVQAGEILGLIGENGAGKSTLLRVLNGVYPHGTYEGVIRIGGEEVELRSPNDAMNRGIGFVPQEINVLKSFSVAENIFIADLKMGQKRRTVNFRELYKETRILLDANGIELNPRDDVRKLSVGQQQMLMIARALAKDPKILILDEPTTSLSDHDVKRLFEVVRKLKNQGRSIVFVTHKLAEILELTDRLCILRDGRNVGEFDRDGYDSGKIIHGMIGREISNMYPSRSVPIGEEALRVENLTIAHEFIEGRNRVEQVSFSVRKGEVLGLAGLVGAGRTETVSAIFGLMKKVSGTISINGKKVNISTTEQAIRHGMAMVTEDRKKYGLIFIWDILKNISLSDLKSVTRLRLFISALQEKKAAEKQFRSLRIKAPSVTSSVASLSGGNQQKVVLARSLNISPEIVFLDEPTKGIDVGSKNEIYQLINELAAQQVAVVMISSELPELMAICDRFIVLAEGRISGEFDKEQATEMHIMDAAVKTFKNI